MTPQQLEAIFEGKPFDKATIRHMFFMLAIAIVLGSTAWLVHLSH